MRYVYGPVPSWRLGKSLGVDPVSTPVRTCSFDCVYCQLGPAIEPLTERQVFVEANDLDCQLKEFKDVQADTVTFSGMAEPTLALNLADLAKVTKKKSAAYPCCYSHKRFSSKQKRCSK